MRRRRPSPAPAALCCAATLGSGRPPPCRFGSTRRPVAHAAAALRSARRGRPRFNRAAGAVIEGAAAALFFSLRLVQSRHSLTCAAALFRFEQICSSASPEFSSSARPPPWSSSASSGVDPAGRVRPHVPLHHLHLHARRGRGLRRPLPVKSF